MKNLRFLLVLSVLWTLFTSFNTSNQPADKSLPEGLKTANYENVAHNYKTPKTILFNPLNYIPKI